MKDICSNKHKGSETSIEADKKVDKVLWRTKILEYARGREIWLHDVCRHFGKPANATSPRIAELKERNLLIPTGNRKEGCACYIANE